VIGAVLTVDPAVDYTVGLPVKPKYLNILVV